MMRSPTLEVTAGISPEHQSTNTAPCAYIISNRYDDLTNANFNLSSNTLVMLQQYLFPTKDASRKHVNGA